MVTPLQSKAQRTKKVYSYTKGQFDTIASPQQILDSLNLIIKKTKNKELKKEYLRSIFFDYLSCPPTKDLVMVTLFDTYCSTPKKCYFLDENEQRVFKRKVNTKRKLMIGNILPPFEGYDRDQLSFHTDSINKPYTILWVWDPDCDHCQEATPELHEFYVNYADTYQFEVVAVSVTEDEERWVKFIDDQHLTWINLSYAMGDYNYDLIEYLDLMQTPAIYIVDKDNKIVAREFSFDELETIFKSLQP